MVVQGQISYTNRIYSPGISAHVFPSIEKKKGAMGEVCAESHAGFLIY